MICPFCGKDAIHIRIEDDEGNEHYDCDYEDNPWSGLWYGIGHWTVDEDCPLSGKAYDAVYDNFDEAKKHAEQFIDDYEYLMDLSECEDYSDLDPAYISSAANRVIKSALRWELL